MDNSHAETQLRDQTSPVLDEQIASRHGGDAEAQDDNPKVMRRGLLAVLGGLGAAAMFKVTGAKAAANVTVNAGSTAAYGVLASPGAAGAPISPSLGVTTHGVIGSNTGTAIPIGSGVCGARSGTNLAGVIGVNGSSGYGVYGLSDAFVGVAGHSESGTGNRGTSVSGWGAFGKSNGNYGVVAQTTANNKAALLAQSLAAGTKVAGLFKGNVRVEGNFQVTGAKNAAVEMADGTLALMYCQESPEPFFEDFGRGKLVNGVAEILLEGEFASLVKLENYMVFLTPEGDTHGLFVSKRGEHGFEVRETRGGNGSLEFTYRLVAKRKDIPGERLARVERMEEIDVAEFEPAPPRTSYAGYSGSDDDHVHVG